MSKKEDHMWEVARIKPSDSNKNIYENKILRISGISMPSEVDGDVFLTSTAYKDIFGKTRKSSSVSNKRLSVVKISVNGRSIHRAYRSVPADNFTKNYVALTSKSIGMLVNNGIEPTEVDLAPGCRFLFYWNHPDLAIRLSMKLGMLSIALALLSIVISIYFSI
jgi:hypothetical protein